MTSQKLTLGQKFSKMINRAKSPSTDAKIKVKGQLFRQQTDKVCFDVKHKAHIVDIRDADFNESQKLLTEETLDDYFSLVHQTVPVKFSPFS